MQEYTNNLVCHLVTYQSTSSLRRMEPPVNYFVRAAFLKVNRPQKIHRYGKDPPPPEKDRDQMRNQKKEKSEIEIIKRITENVTIL